MRNRGDVAGDVPGHPARRAASHIPRSGELPMTPLAAPLTQPDAESDDVRAQRLASELLLASQELARVHRELEALRERMRRDAAERSELLDAIGHELRTPLTVISGYHRMLLGSDVG